MAIRLKVDVSTLKAKAEEKLAELEAEVEGQRAEYEAAVLAYPSKADLYAMEETEKMVEAGEIWDIFEGSSWRNRSKRQGTPPEFPTKPDNEREIARVKRDIGLLKASSQTTVTISTDSDLARYL